MRTTTAPHIRLTVEEIRAQYLTGKLTVKGYIYNWLLATRKRGWRYRTKVKDFCKELGISRSAFYKAIAELKAEPGSNFHFEIYGEIAMWIDEPSTGVDKMSTIVDTVSTIVDTASTTIDNKTPKPAQDKASTAPTDLDQISSDLLQIEGDEDCLNEDKQPTARGGLVDPQPAESSIDVAKILEETKNHLLAVVQRQREERERKNFRGAAALGALEPNTTPSSHGGHGQHHGQWDREKDPRATTTTPSSHGGHGERYRWRVRGGGLQPLAGVLLSMSCGHKGSNGPGASPPLRSGSLRSGLASARPSLPSATTPHR
jgi:hypothetical protein